MALKERESVAQAAAEVKRKLEEKIFCFEILYFFCKKGQTSY